MFSCTCNFEYNEKRNPSPPDFVLKVALKLYTLELGINLDCKCKNCWGWRCGSQLVGFTSINISNPLKFSTLFSFFHFLTGF